MADSGREEEENHSRRHGHDGRKRGFGHGGEASPPPESRRERHRSPIDRRDERSFVRSQDGEDRGRHGRDGTRDVKRQGLSDSEDEPRRGSHGTDRSGRRRDSQQDSPIRRSSLHGGRGREEDRYVRKRQDGEHFPGDHKGRRRDSQQESPTRRSSFHDRRGREEERYDRKRQDELESFGDGSHDGGSGRSMNADGSYGRRRGMDEDAGRDRFAGRYRNAEQNNEELPDLYSVHRAKVQSVRPFGIFVRLEGFSKQGLVHLSQLSDHEVTDREDPDVKKVQAIAAIAGEGDQVWVKVISLKDEGGNVKIGCSLKLVSQSTGQDLDPSNVKLEQQQPKGNRQEPKKVTLDAIYNVVCSRCGGHGHLKTECYATADKSYELLPEEDYELTEQTAQPLQDKMLSREAANTPGIGRGRAMVLPAWMTHGTGASVPQQLGREPKKKKKESELPDSVTTVEEALALIAQVKKEKKDKRHRKKEHSKHKKQERSKKASKKGSASRKDKG